MYGFCRAQPDTEWKEGMQDGLLKGLQLRERNMNGDVTVMVRWLLLHCKAMTFADVFKMTRAQWMSTARLRWTEALSFLRGYLDGGGNWILDTKGMSEFCDVLERVEDMLPGRMQQLFFELTAHEHASRKLSSSQSGNDAPSPGDEEEHDDTEYTVDLSSLKEALMCDNIGSFPLLPCPPKSSEEKNKSSSHADEDDLCKNEI